MVWPIHTVDVLMNSDVHKMCHIGSFTCSKWGFMSNVIFCVYPTTALHVLFIYRAIWITPIKLLKAFLIIHNWSVFSLMHYFSHSHYYLKGWLLRLEYVQPHFSISLSCKKERSVCCTVKKYEWLCSTAMRKRSFLGILFFSCWRLLQYFSIFSSLVI